MAEFIADFASWVRAMTDSQVVAFTVVVFAIGLSCGSASGDRK